MKKLKEQGGKEESIKLGKNMGRVIKKALARTPLNPNFSKTSCKEFTVALSVANPLTKLQIY